MRIFIDGHCDTLTCTFDDKLFIDDNKYYFNTKDATRFAPVIQCAATFIDPEYEDGFKRANEVIDYFLENKRNAVLIKNKEDISDIINNKKVGMLLSIENGKAIENDINNVDLLYEKGIRMMSVNWNEDKLLGTGALTNKNTGLTNFGIEYIKKLESKNIIIDVSHSSEKTFWDIVENSSKTLVASHSCCYNICKHKRNLKDDQLKEIAKRDGIVGICLCSPFLKEHGKANVKDIIKHIKYIIDLIGEDYVGLGTDFDGVEEENQLDDIKKISDIKLLEEELIKEGFKRDTINKIMGENWLRVINNNL